MLRQDSEHDGSACWMCVGCEERSCACVQIAIPSHGHIVVFLEDGNFWDEEKLGRVTSRVVGTARTMSHYRVTTREGAQVRVWFMR